MQLGKNHETKWWKWSNKNKWMVTEINHFTERKEHNDDWWRFPVISRMLEILTMIFWLFVEVWLFYTSIFYSYFKQSYRSLSQVNLPLMRGRPGQGGQSMAGQLFKCEFSSYPLNNSTSNSTVLLSKSFLILLDISLPGEWNAVYTTLSCLGNVQSCGTVAAQFCHTGFFFFF